MKAETPKTTKKSGSWSAARQRLATQDKLALLALVKDLYEMAAGNRDFIHARCQVDDGDGDVLETYRCKIVEKFYPKRVEGKLKLGGARKAIREYRKATGNISGTAELLMTFVETGVRYTNDHGDINERFYSSVELALSELAAQLRGDARELYPQFRARLVKIEQETDGVGWGFHDFIADVVWRLEADFGQP